MNLWNFIPEFPVIINGVFYLPHLFYVTVLGYFYVIYALIKHAMHRPLLATFFLVSIIASTAMFTSLGPSIGKVFHPLLLLTVMLIPLSILSFHVIKKNKLGITIWTIATIAGWLHSFTWASWLYVLARS